MVFLRIVSGIRQHFDARVAEWGLGAFIINYGLGLLGPENAWTVPAAWAGMTAYMSENAWGAVCILLGIARLAALAVNGTFADTVYSRYSPFVRGLVALASAAFWFMVILSLSHYPSIGTRAYALPLALEVWCLTRAWRDNGREGKRARGRSGLA